MPGRETAGYSRRSRSRSRSLDRSRTYSSSNPYKNVGRLDHSKPRLPEKDSHRDSRDDEKRRHGSGARDFYKDRDRDRRDSGQYRHKRKHRGNHSGEERRHQAKEEVHISWKHREPEDECQEHASHRDSAFRARSPNHVVVKREDCPASPTARPSRLRTETPPPSQCPEQKPNPLISRKKVPEEVPRATDAEAIWAREKIDTGRRTSLGGTGAKLDPLKSDPEDVPMVCDAERASPEIPEARVTKLSASDKERKAWERQKITMEEKMKAYEAERATWEQEKASADGKLNSLQNELSIRDVTIERLEKKNDDMGVTMFKWENKLREMKEELQEVEARYRRRKSEVDFLQDNLHRAERELAQTKTLLEARTEENKVAQAFMTTADHYSIADVSRMVDLLNNEIFQCAMEMSDALLQCREADTKYTPAEDEAWKPQSEHACKEAADIWSEPIVSQIREGVEKGETTLFDCLAQSVFVTRCCQVIQCFCPENSELDEYMDEMWARILNTNEMPISKKWLAITSQALGHPSFGNESVMSRLACLLTVAGWRPTPSDASLLQKTIEVKLADIFEKAVKIREMILEGVLSANVQVFCFGMNEMYDPLQMLDAYDAPGRRTAGGCSDKEPIICTTGLGLRCAVAGDKESGGWKREVIMKAKVVMQSSLMQ